MQLRGNFSKIVCVFGLFVLMAGFLFFDSDTTERTFRTYNFKFREALHRTPTFSKKIKILALDDHAVDAIGGVDLSPDQWAELLSKIATREPRAIVIDKIFSIVPGDESQMSKISAAMGRTKTYIASSTSVVKSHWRTAFDAATPGNLLTPDLQVLPGFLQKASPATLYGPAEQLMSGLAGVGFISSYRFGEVKSALRATDNAIAAHLALLASGEVAIGDGKLKVGGTALQTRSDGYISVNFPTKADLFDATYSLQSFFQDATPNAETAIEKDDIVLILPLYFTGNADFADTPIGRLPGGFVLASLLNSCVNNTWIINVSDYKILTNISLAVVGFVATSLLPPLYSFVFIVTFSLACAFFGLLSFAYFGVEFAWLEGCISFLISSLWMSGFRYWSYSNGMRRLRASFGGLVPNSRMSMMFDNWENIQRVPVERKLSVMFIDIVGFSVYADNTKPEEVFSTLRSQLEFLTRIIHKHGGIVDKSLGDGMLCFFGYDYAGKFVDEGQAGEGQSDAAISCAVEIQNSNLRGILHETSKHLPLRIGINTATVLIGDLGNEERIDFTIIGSGVNIAQRFESACEHHKILVSEATFQLSKSFSKEHKGFRSRMIPVKHHINLLKVIEIDPLVFDQSLKADFSKWIASKESDVTDREQRWDVFGNLRLAIFVGEEEVELVNFSKGGLQLKMDAFLAKGVTCMVKITVHDETLQNDLVARGLDEIPCEIRWGRESSDHSRYLHGLAFKYLTASQRNFLSDILKNQITDKKQIKSIG